MYRILFIDNDQASQVLYDEICRHNGIHYVGITNPTKLETYIKSNANIDLFVVDLEMPHIDGYEVLSILRSIYLHKPIVACTVHNGELERAKSFGFSSFIVKPLNIDNFSVQLISILKGQEVWETYGG